MYQNHLKAKVNFANVITNIEQQTIKGFVVQIAKYDGMVIYTIFQNNTAVFYTNSMYYAKQFIIKNT